MNTYNSQAAPARTLRLWPGVVIVILLWASSLVPGWIIPGTMEHMMIMMFGGMAMQVAFLVWWLFFTRVSWADRLGILGVAIAMGLVAYLLSDKSYQNMFFLMFVPTMVMTVAVGWLFLSQKMSWPTRRVGLLLAIMATFAFYTTIRLEGTDGYFAQEMSFRWNPSAEETYLARADIAKLTAKTAPVESAKPLELQAGDWPGFRGSNRDSRLAGVTINSNWKDNPPRELWRHDVGPGWSSFCVVSDRVFTQEQHDQKEAIVCYDANTGKTIWVHHDAERFWDPIGGAGPRATPTFFEGKLYTMGSKGRLNCLDAATGNKLWSRNIVDDSKAKIPDWGFSSSPLVAKGIVTVFCGGPEKKATADEAPDDKSVLAYRADTGEPAWTSGNGRSSYCSTQLSRLNDVEQIVVSAGNGLTSFDPANGKELWNYEWKLDDGINRVVQPTILSDTDLLIGTGFGLGTHRVHVTYDGSKWEPTKVWSTNAFSPYYNDLVIYKDHAYGFDTGKLICVSLKDGKRMWKERGYDNGQVLLLADQGLLLVQCEKGDVALVEASPDKCKELARFKALEGKTWNHPVIANGKLFVRNDRVAACFELKLEAGKKE